MEKKKTLPIVYRVGRAQLIGSAHLLPSDVCSDRFSIDPRELISQYVIDSKEVVFEANPDDTPNVKSEYRVSSTFSQEELASLREKLKADLVVKDPEYQKLRALDNAIESDDLLAFVFTLAGIQIFINFDKLFEMDSYTRRLTTDLGIPVGYLELAEDAISMLAKTTTPESARLFYLVIVAGKFKTRVNNMSSAYLDGDIDRMRKIAAEIPTWYQSESLLVTSRDENFYRNSRDRLSRRTTIMLGAIHIPGFLERAGRDGYAIERIPYV